MDNKQNSEFSEVKSQINEIKNVMSRGGSTFRLIYAASNFRSMFLLSGIFSLILPIIYQVMIWVYKSCQMIPKPVLIGYYFLIFLCWCVLIVVRTKASIDVSKRLDLEYSILSIFKQVLSTKIWLSIVPVLIFLVVIPIKFSAAFTYYDYAPYFGIVLGLVLNMIGIMIYEREYSVAGTWMIISGAVFLLFISIPIHVALAIVLAPACFLFVTSNIASSKGMENTNEGN